ncbi:MAG: polymerase [Treponema sp.]|nr:MAG: polymerase [Treponema sp.]
MVRLEQIQQKMQELYKKDSSRFFVEARGSELDEAIASAAIQLGIPAANVDYEVTQKGKSGMFALNPCDWIILAYQNDNIKLNVDESDGQLNAGSANVIEEQKDKNGQVFISCLTAGVFMKVTAPVGNGKKVKIDDAIKKIKAKNLDVPAEKVLMPIIKKAKGEYIRIAPFKKTPGNDAMLTVNIRDDGMAAYLHVYPPGPGGADFSAEEIVLFLNNNDVVFGIDDNRLVEFQDNPVYKEDYLIAEGQPAKNGNDAKIEYNFRVDTSVRDFSQTTSGQINFKELNIIQNVVEGQPVAQKIPAQRGEPGKTVSGKYLEASSGKDVVIPIGENTKIADDGLTVIAEINGHVSLKKGRITVEPVYVVEGNVSIKTGNIEFLGAVFVNGNVDDGFSIRASGNIEVKGTVGKSELDAEGDIVISQGIIGKEGALIRTSQSIWSKFIQNAKSVEAGKMVVVSDGIINSNVLANKKIICKGKRADIIGGNISAAEFISARNLGSPTAGNDTTLNVGFDPKSKERLDFLRVSQENNEKMLAEVKLNLTALENQKKRRGGTLSEEKEETYQKYIETKYTLETEIEEAKQEVQKIKEHLETIKIEGKVSASGDVFAGVTINIKNFTEVVRTDCKATTFFLDKGIIRYGKYEKEEEVKGPGGYSTN